MARRKAPSAFISVILLLVCYVQNVISFSLERRSLPPTSRALTDSSRCSTNAGPDNAVVRASSALGSLSSSDGQDEDIRTGWGRREVLGSIAIATGALWTNPLTASADEGGLDCLLDLPPVPSDSVRVYLCRHGQTENNRLRMVQGSRVDPPINQNGIEMASRLGKALSQLGDQCPDVFAHSPLLRAKETAQVASLNSGKKVELKELKELAEVDFGPLVEGKDVSAVREDMVKTYAEWSCGRLDVRGGGGGESCREVLSRASVALNGLTQEAASNGGSIVAVAHSAYLRMLLATLLDISLAEAATLDQKNGCINVLDLKRDGCLRKLGPKSTLFGGVLSAAPSSFQLEVPVGTVTRVNEKRHLDGISLV